MNPDLAYELIKISLTEGAIIIAPLVIVALAVGIIVGIFQSVTSIQEQSLTFVPKLFASGIAIWLLAPWMLEKMCALVALFFQRAGEVLR
jgi:flagellar biosynthetic protein FliQ